VAGPAPRDDSDIAGVGGAGVLGTLPGEPAEYEPGHRIGVGGLGDQCGSRGIVADAGIVAAHSTTLSRKILDNRGYLGLMAIYYRLTR
jgi:hypothetical protein